MRRSATKSTISTSRIAELDDGWISIASSKEQLREAPNPSKTTPNLPVLPAGTARVLPVLPDISSGFDPFFLALCPARVGKLLPASRHQITNTLLLIGRRLDFTLLNLRLG